MDCFVLSDIARAELAQVSNDRFAISEIISQKYFPRNNFSEIKRGKGCFFQVLKWVSWLSFEFNSALLCALPVCSSVKLWAAFEAAFENNYWRQFGFWESMCRDGQESGCQGEPICKVVDKIYIGQSSVWVGWTINCNLELLLLSWVNVFKDGQMFFKTPTFADVGPQLPSIWQLN